MSATPPGPLVRSNYLNWPPGLYQANADPNNPAFDPTTAQPASGVVLYGDAALDAEQYHRPRERLHGMGLHAAGVAFGMQISCTIGQPDVTVASGLAMDGWGRHIYLADQGQAEVSPTANDPSTPSVLVDVAATGAVLPTAGYSGDFFVVAGWWESWDSAGYASDPSIGQYSDTPWLLLVPAAGYPPAGYDTDAHVVLGKISLDNNANVTAISYGDAGGVQRTSISVPAQSLQLKRAINTSAPGADTATWGAVRAREPGGIEIAVAKGGDQVNVLCDAGGAFASFAVGADLAAFGSLTNPGITLNAAEATVSVGAPGNYGDVLVYDGANHLSVSLIGDTGHVIVGGSTLAGEVRMKNASAQDTMTLNGDTGSAVVQRVKAFANNAIDVDTTFLRVHGTDLMLDGRSKKNNRALVDWGNLLIINYATDYHNGVKIEGNLESTGNLQVDGSLQVNGDLQVDGVVNGTLQINGTLTDANGTPLMANPARKLFWQGLFAGSDQSGDQSTSTQDIDFGQPTQFTAMTSTVSLHIYDVYSFEATYGIEVYQVDGTDTTPELWNGQGWGGQGADSNLHQSIWSGQGQVVTFRLTCIGDTLEALAYGIVFFE